MLDSQPHAAGRDSETVLRSFVEIESAAATNLIEEGERRIPARGREVPVSIGRHAIETFELRLSGL